MKTLPPCDHDECPPTRCLQTANAQGVGSKAVFDAAFAKYVDAADAAREIKEELLDKSPAYQAAKRREEEAWAECERLTESKQASNIGLDRSISA